KSIRTRPSRRSTGIAAPPCSAGSISWRAVPGWAAAAMASVRRRPERRSALSSDLRREDHGMGIGHVNNVDLARVFDAPEKGKFLRVMAWGDAVEVVRVTAEHVEGKLFTFEPADEGFTPGASSGFIVPPAGIKPAQVVLPKTDDRVLRVNFVDVQQGDGAVIETAKGTVVLIDGG